MEKSKKMLILLIDDDPLICELFCAKYKNSDIEILVANNYEDSQKIINDNRPIAILLDITLPGINGFEILKLLKSNPKTKDILVLMLSNSALNEDIVKSKELGAEDFLVKSNFNIEEVVSRIQTHLESN